MFEYIKNSNIIWVILSLCTVASLVFGIISWVKSKKRKQFTYATKSNYIILNKANQIEKLDLKFDGKSIDNLTITTIVIWNSQNSEIRIEDIVTDYELTVFSKGDTEILDAKIIFESEPANKFSIIETTLQKVRFGFEYVDKKDGLVAQIIHTGKSRDINVDVKIKGGESIREYNNRQFNKKPKGKYILSWIGTVLSEVAYLGIIISTIVSLINKSNNTFIFESGSPLWLKIFLTVFLAIGFIGLGFSAVYEIRKITKSSVPSCFRDFI